VEIRQSHRFTFHPPARAFTLPAPSLARPPSLPRAGGSFSASAQNRANQIRQPGCGFPPSSTPPPAPAPTPSPDRIAACTPSRAPSPPPPRREVDSPPAPTRRHCRSPPLSHAAAASPPRRPHRPLSPLRRVCSSPCRAPPSLSFL
jgi:hypothetical protein